LTAAAVATIIAAFGALDLVLVFDMFAHIFFLKKQLHSNTSRKFKLTTPTPQRKQHNFYRYAT